MITSKFLKKTTVGKTDGIRILQQFRNNYRLPLPSLHTYSYGFSILQKGGFRSEYCSEKLAKGQLISECLFEKIVWTKIPTKNLIDSAQQV